jgi:hypothetical protein
MKEVYTYVYTKAIKKYEFQDFPEIRLTPGAAAMPCLGLAKAESGQKRRKQKAETPDVGRKARNGIIF